MWLKNKRKNRFAFLDIKALTALPASLQRIARNNSIDITRARKTMKLVQQNFLIHEKMSFLRIMRNRTPLSRETVFNSVDWVYIMLEKIAIAISPQCIQLVNEFNFHSEMHSLERTSCTESQLASHFHLINYYAMICQEINYSSFDEWSRSSYTMYLIL